MANSVDLGSVVAKLELDIAGFKESIGQVKDQIGQTASHTQKSATVMGSALDNVAKVGMAGLAVATAAAMALVVTNIGAAVKRVDTLDNSARTFENMGIKSTDAKDAIAKLTTSIQGLPTPLDSAIRGMTDLTATYGDVDTGRKVFTALNNAILGFGGTADSVRNAVTQLSQLPMDGPLDGQTWLSLRNSGLTPVLVAMAKDMGIGIGEMREKFMSGQLTVRDFTNKLIEMDEKGGGGMKSLAQIAKDSTKGIGTSIENMKTAVTRGIASILRAIGTEDIAKAITAIGTAFENALKESSGFIQFIKDNKDFISPIIVGITGFVAVITVLYTWFKWIKPAIIGFNAVLSANPVVLITASIIALIAGLAYFFTQTETGRKIWEKLTGAFSKFWEVIKPIREFIGDQLISAFDSLKEIWNQLVVAMQPLIEMFQEFWSKHGDKVMTVLKYIGIAVAGIFLAPLVASFALLLGALKIIAVVLRFVADHFDTIKKVVIVMVLTAFSPLIIAIGLLVGAFKLIQWAIGATIDFFVALYKGVVDAWQKTQKAVEDGINAVSKFFTDGWNAIKDFFVGVWQAIYNAVINPLTAIYNFVVAVLTFIKNLYIIVFGSILLVILTVMGFIKDAFINAWNAIYAFLAPVVTAIWNVISTAFIFIRDTIQNAIQAVWNFIVTAWNAIYAFIMPIVQTIFNFLSNTFNAIKNTVVTAVQGVWNFVTTAWNAIYGIFVGITQKIVGYFSGAYNWLLDKGRDIVRGLADGIRSFANAVWDAISAVSAKIGQFFSNAGSWLYNVGRDIVTGLINGIKSMVGAVSGAAGDVGNAVKSKLKSVLGIGSPSKITAQYGVWVGEGFNNGLEGMQRAIGRTLSETFALAPSAVEDLSGTFNAGLTVPRASQMTNGKEVNQTNSSNLTINGNINISNQADADYLLSRLSRRQDLTVQGLVGA
jgi:tape measure domain-containing protein